jgi:hypothetical protein
MKTININEFIDAMPPVCSLYRSKIKIEMVDFAEQVLKLAAENADIYIPDGAYMDNYVNPDRIEIDKQSILNTINQII